MNIRKAMPSDAIGIHEMHMRSIRENCASHYSQREITAWGGRKYDEPHRLGTIQNDHVLVLVDGGTIRGYSHLSCDGELRALYLDSSAIGHGFGKRLLEQVEVEARRQNLARIFLDSTLNAVGFYSHHGFVATGEEHAVTINGELIRCLPMETKLKR